LPFPYTVAVAIAVAYLFAVYGCNGTEFSYVIFTEQRNFTTAERRNGNGMAETAHDVVDFRSPQDVATAASSLS